MCTVGAVDSTGPLSAADETLLRALVSRLRAELHDLAHSMAIAVQEEFEAYRATPAEAIRRQIVHNASLTLSLVEQRRLPDRRELQQLTDAVRERAEQGFPLDLVLGAHRLLGRLLWTRARDLAAELGADAASVREMYEFEAETLGMTFVEAASVHRQVELATARSAQERLVAAMQDLLTRPQPPEATAELARRLGLDPTRPYRVICAAPCRGASVAELKGSLIAAGPGDGVFVSWSDTVVGLEAPLEDRRALHDVVAGASAPVLLKDAAAAYASARRALVTAQRFGLVGLHDVHDLGARVAVCDDDEVTRALRAKYLDPLEAAGGIREDLIRTMRGYLDARLRRDAAAASMHMHPNTLSYRVAKFVQLTGADLDDMTTVVELWWAFQSLQLDDAPRSKRRNQAPDLVAATNARSRAPR